jgi:hypothetical protein
MAMAMAMVLEVYYDFVLFFFFLEATGILFEDRL